MRLRVTPISKCVCVSELFMRVLAGVGLLVHGRAGADAVDAAIDSMSGTTSQPSMVRTSRH